MGKRGGERREGTERGREEEREKGEKEGEEEERNGESVIYS